MSSEIYLLCGEQTKGKFSKCSYVVKNMLFCSYCTSLLLFACHPWNNFCKPVSPRTICNGVKVAYNDAYQILHKLPRFVSACELQVSFGITSFESLRFFN